MHMFFAGLGGALVGSGITLLILERIFAPKTQFTLFPMPQFVMIFAGIFFIFLSYNV